MTSRRSRPRVVVDASTVVKWALDDEDAREPPRELRDDLPFRDRVSAEAPTLILHEISNALLRSERKRRARRQDVDGAVAVLLAAGMPLRATRPTASLDAARRLIISAYDAAYVAPAARTGSTLWTGDRRFVNSARLDFVRWIGDYSPPESSRLIRYSARMTKLQFRNEDARIAYLATVYHLGRPGSETAAVASGQKHDLGLQAIHDEMLPRLDQAVVEVEVSAYQLIKLGEALLGVTNELKQYGMADGRSMVPQFQETMQWLYPETKDEPGSAIDIVTHAVMLHRRLGSALAEAQQDIAAQGGGSVGAPGSGSPWWKFW